MGTGFIGIVNCAEIAVNKANEKIHVIREAEILDDTIRILFETIPLLNSIDIPFYSILYS
jgi:hypothetical protein